MSVADVRRSGDVLVLVPAALDELPEPDVLSELAAQLREQMDVRYVTLGVDAAEDA